MPKFFRYSLYFLIGIILGFLYLWFWQPQLLDFMNGGITRRASLESGLLWKAEETEHTSSDPFSTLTSSSSIPTPTSLPSLSLLFTGDVMLDRHVRLKVQTDGYDSLLSDELKQLLQQHDLVVVNLEGPITDQSSVSLGTEPGDSANFIFTFDPQAANFLADHNLRLANLGNNHISNFGEAGIISTLNYLHQAGVEHFGWVATATELEEYNQEYLALELKDFLLGLVNFNQFSNQSFESALEAVRLMRDKVEYLIVFTHWGEEYVPEPNQIIKNQAHLLVDAGADLVIGTHPHVIQPWEDYQGARIYYSLGNFIFDQYFSPEVKRGLLVQANLEKIGANEHEGEVDDPAEVDDGDLARQKRVKVEFKEFEVAMESGQAVRLVEDSAENDI